MRAKRTKIGIQSRKQFFQDLLKLSFVLLPKQPSLICASQKMSHFIKGPARDTNEPLMIGWRCSPVTLRDVRANAVRRTHELMSDCILGKLLPTNHDVPDQIGQFFRHRIYPEAIERKFCHTYLATSPAHAWRPITNC